MSSRNMRLKYGYYNEEIYGTRSNYLALTDGVLEYDRAD